MGPDEKNSQSGLEIAVIGISGRFPGAKNIEEFWTNLKTGVEGIGFFNPAELEESGVGQEISNDSNYISACGIVEDIDCYDASFFGYLPVEAELMDPQVRIFHEVVWEALEDAGYIPDTYRGRIGIYAGASAHLRWEVLALISGKAEKFGYFAAWQLYDKDFMSTRISYNLNLLGPSVNVQTACSTSLTAIHLACQGLLGGECHMALAGGVTALIPVKSGYIYQEGMIFSPDGHCRPFAHNARGTVSSEGAGVVLLKPLENAIADRDFIYAVIKSTAINNDGKSKVGYTAPSVKAQARVIRSALRLARVKSESISYVETHGTGTQLGDPVEIEALKLAFKTGKKGFCRIGSVKSNIGHLDSAAGVAGLIKTVLALKHRIIPPSLHFVTPNPKIDFENSPFVVNTHLTPWENNENPLRAGVSSFGVGGTNVHAILEEWPGNQFSISKGNENDTEEEKLIILSARSESSLEKATGNLLALFQQKSGISLADAAYTLQVGRKAFKHRRLIMCRNIMEVLSIPPLSSISESDAKRVVFMFPGQGSQYTNMGLDLYENEPVFREEMDHCFEILNRHVPFNIKEILYPRKQKECRGGSPCPPNKNLDSHITDLFPSPMDHDINQTENAQPVLFIIEYSLAKLLVSWGITPYAMVGHSIGEYVAACLSGVFNLEDALQIVAARGQLMQQTTPGAMLSVSLNQSELIPLLSTGAYEDICLAAVNSPGNCIVSGSYEVIEGFSRELTGKGYENRRLHTSHAFHSHMMNPVLEQLTMKIRSFSLNKPGLPYISNLTGQWITVADALDPAYWSKHLRQTVLFSNGMEEILKIKGTVLLEVGPGKALATFARQHIRGNQLETDAPLILEMMRHPKEKHSDHRFLLDKIGQLWLEGAKIDWIGFNTYKNRSRIPLPTYPFEGEHFPIAGDPFNMDAEVLMKKVPSEGKNKEIKDWFYIPSWERAPFPRVKSLDTAAPVNWLVFIDQHGIGQQLIEKLKYRQSPKEQSIIVVKEGSVFSRESEGEFTLNPQQESDYHQLFKILAEIKTLPRNILHLWGVTGSDSKERKEVLDLAGLDTILDTGFHSLVHIARELGKHLVKEKIYVGVITDDMQEVMGNESLNPGKAAVMGALKVIPSEYPNIRCCSIDITLEPNLLPVELLIAEFAANLPDQVIAFRGKHRWVQAIKPAPVDTPGPQEEIIPPLKKNGIYLITGGLGGIGLTLAAYLAQNVQARMVLTSRMCFPAREEWNHWLNNRDKSHSTSVKIQKLMEIESQGAEIMVLEADVANLEDMQKVNHTVQQQWGLVNGIIHSAGVPDGALIQARTPAITRDVFQPKIKGTYILDQVFDHQSLDFFIICSSLSSVLGFLGQVAYSAANAFQDAFALYKTYRFNNSFTVSIGWDTWQEVGMAVEAMKKLTRSRESVETSAPRQPVAHPLFDYSIEKNSSEKIYITHFCVDKYWVLGEHRILDKSTLPGTALLEMARAALEDHTGNSEIEICEIYFLTPVRMEDNGEKVVHTYIKKQGQRYKFNISSQTDSTSKQCIEHARGEMEINLLKSGPNRKHKIEELKAMCNEEELIITREMLETNREEDPLNFVFGPRWKNIKKINFGNHRVLLSLELDSEFSEDIGLYKLHPALLDTATGAYSRKNAVLKASLPFAYQEVTVKAPLTSRIYSYQEYSVQNLEDENIMKFSIIIMDDQGMELVDIREYQRLVVSDSAVSRISQETVSSPGEITVLSNENDLGDNDVLQHGLLPAEGVEVFRRILGNPFPHVVISTIDFAVRLEANRSLNDKMQLVKEVDHGSKPATYRPRSGINKPYVPPVNETESQMAQIWQDFLGIEKVGTRDNFFQMGGDSLKVVTIIAIIQKKMDVEVPLSEFFNNPTIAGAVEYIDKVKESIYTTIEPVEESTEVFTKQIPGDISKSDLEQKAAKHSVINPIEKRDYYELSSAQRRLYFLQQFETNSTVYNISQVIPLAVIIPKLKLEGIVKKLITRHDSLRTYFSLVDDILVQRIFNPDKIQFQVEDIHIEKDWDEKGTGRKGKDFHNQELMISGLLQRFIRPFDLSKAPLLRIGLLNTFDSKQILFFDIHHIIADATSYNILIQEFYSLYSGEGINPIKLRYRDFSEWQNREAQQEFIKREEEYWLNLLSGELPLINLPTDYPRPLVQSFAGALSQFRLDEKLTKQLRYLANENEVTLFMILFTIFNILLSKLGGQEEIIVGVPISTRNYVGLENIFGLFINTLAMQNDISADKTFKELLNTIKTRTIEAFNNQQYQFEDLVDRLAVPRDTAHNPVFDVMFNFLNQPENKGDIFMADKESQSIFNNITSKFDLTLTGVDAGKTLDFNLEYCTALFKSGTIERFARYFLHIFIDILENPGQKISDINILTEDEKYQLLLEFNDTHVKYLQDITFFELFVKQVEAIPDHIILIGTSVRTGNNMSISYQELNKKCCQLGNELFEFGVESNKIIGLMTGRNLEMVIGLLAILKSGSAYLPIDPEYPPGRIHYMLEQTGISTLVVTDPLYSFLEGYPSLKIIDLSKELCPTSASVDKVVAIHENPSSDDLIYVMYTSGTTGVPKGVMIEHRSMVNFIKGITDVIPFGICDRILSLTTLSFDIFGLEILLPLTTGTGVVIGDERIQMDSGLAARVLSREQITIFQATPSRLQLFLSYPGASGSLKEIKHLIVGGEAFPYPLLEETRELMQGKIYNVYGPTETTIWSTIKEVTGDDNITIGKPLANTHIYIFDRANHLQPMGIAGELCIAGHGLARGYLNDLELTEEKFCHRRPGAFSKMVSARRGDKYYRTGDLSRWLSDGNIEFLGRIDHQVKLRGYRIELREIEAQLLECKGIKEAVVKLFERNQDKYLCAYIVVKDSGNALEISILKEKLGKYLPTYMIPSFFIKLDQIPLTTNGKINRNALPVPSIQKDDRYVAPRNEVERQLVKIWHEVFDRDASSASSSHASQKDTPQEIGIDADFFDLGGHSLKGIILINKLYKQLNLKLSLSELFKRPTIRRLAEFLAGETKYKYLSIKKVEEKEYYLLSSAQKRLYFQQQKNPGSIKYNMPTILILKGEPCREKIQGTLRKLIERHESLRTSFEIINGEIVQRVHREIDFDINDYDFQEKINSIITSHELHTTNTEQLMMKNILKEFIKPFCLTGVPLLHVGLIKIEKKKHLLMVDMHHIISDGISINVLTIDFMAMYGGKRLPDIRIQYKDFSVWQNREKNSTDIKRQEEYWMKEYKEDIPILNLPVDFERSNIESYEGDIVNFVIDKRETGLLKKIALEEGTTLFIVLLAIYSILLARLSNQDVVVIGTAVAGRPHVDLDKVMGMFVNTLALKIALEKGKTFREFIHTVNNKTLNAFDNQDYQFDDMVEKLSLTRVKGRNPIFDVRFTMNNFDEVAVDIPGLTLSNYDYFNHESKFDMTLLIKEDGDILKGCFEYRLKLYKKETILQFVNYIREILQVVTMNSKMKLEEITITHGFSMPQINTNRIDLNF